MNKTQFIKQLRERLSALPKKDAEEQIAFYDEMIDDRIEEGLLEEEAVAQMGNVNELAQKILSDFPADKKENKKLKAWQTIFLILGSPLWLSLTVALLAVLISLYVVLWSVAISLWAVFVSLAACALAGIVAGAVLPFVGNTLNGVAMLGGGITSAGLSVFMFFAGFATTKGLITFTKKLVPVIKAYFFGHKGEKR